jgi:hypothetical protein
MRVESAIKAVVGAIAALMTLGLAAFGISGSLALASLDRACRYPGVSATLNGFWPQQLAVA